MIYVHGDISGKPEQRAMVAACWLGSESRWVLADRVWKKALDDAEVKYFHATEFFSCRGQFKGWVQNSPRQIEMAKRFAQVPRDYGLVGFGYAIDVPAFKRYLQPVLLKTSAPHRPASPRSFCVHGCLSRIARLIKQAGLPPGERVAVIFEDEHGIGDAIDYFTYCKRKREPWTSGIISLTSADKSLRPLQIADLLAHEAWRRATTLLTGEMRDPRKPFVQLVGDFRSVDLQIIGEADAKKSAADVVEFLKARPSGLVGPKGWNRPSR